MIRRDSRVRDLPTTNGILLARRPRVARRRAAAGHRELDTLRPERMGAVRPQRAARDVLAGIGAAQAVGFDRLKLNTVVVRGFNEDELVALVEFARARDAEVRFIEYMDVGGATRWSLDQVVSQQEILDRLAHHFGSLTPMTGDDPHAPAERFALPDGTSCGIIASTTAPFCAACDRSRLTADGQWYLCLYAERGIDLREPLRGGASDDELGALIERAWHGRVDRGAEERLGLAERHPLYQVNGLRLDPHREMHTRGG
jgi:cyclic pyranopterin phosphate synthase